MHSMGTLWYYYDTLVTISILLSFPTYPHFLPLLHEITNFDTPNPPSPLLFIFIQFYRNLLKELYMEYHKYTSKVGVKDASNKINCHVKHLC